MSDSKSISIFLEAALPPHEKGAATLINPKTTESCYSLPAHHCLKNPLLAESSGFAGKNREITYVL